MGPTLASLRSADYDEIVKHFWSMINRGDTPLQNVSVGAILFYAAEMSPMDHSSRFWNDPSSIRYLREMGVPITDRICAPLPFVSVDLARIDALRRALPTPTEERRDEKVNSFGGDLLGDICSGCEVVYDDEYDFALGAHDSNST